jgi:hypothetical protein
MMNCAGEPVAVRYYLDVVSLDGTQLTVSDCAMGADAKLDARDVWSKGCPE